MNTSLVKAFLSILLFPFSSLVIGQITFEPVFINPCNDSVAHYIHGRLKDDNGVYRNDDIFSTRIVVPDTGTYQLYYGLQEPPLTVEIRKKGVNRDTFLMPEVRFLVYVSNPPFSEYMNCDRLANGTITEYYKNGNIRIKGTFKEGQLTDTLFHYYNNGQLYCQDIPLKKRHKMTTYFPNGKLQSIYNGKKGFEITYHTNGNLRSERYWKRHSTLSTDYYPDGKPSHIQTKNELIRFDRLGNVTEQISRKETLVLSRILTGRRYDRFYDFVWESFDQNGALKWKTIFSASDFDNAPFPSRLSQIDDYLFDSIIFYENGNEIRKMEFAYESINGLFIKVISIYGKERNEWIFEKKAAKHEVYELFKHYSATKKD